MFRKFAISSFAIGTTLFAAMTPAQAVVAIAKADVATQESANATIKVGRRGGRRSGGRRFRHRGFRHRGHWKRRHWKHWRYKRHWHHGHGWKYYGVYAGSGCYYLKKRWHITGHYHWKRKYYACRGWY